MPRLDTSSRAPRRESLPAASSRAGRGATAGNAAGLPQRPRTSMSMRRSRPARFTHRLHASSREELPSTDHAHRCRRVRTHTLAGHVRRARRGVRRDTHRAPADTAAPREDAARARRARRPLCNRPTATTTTPRRGGPRPRRRGPLADTDGANVPRIQTHRHLRKTRYRHASCERARTRRRAFSRTGTRHSSSRAFCTRVVGR